MKKTLTVGLEYRHTFVVTESKLVPALYPEAEEFLTMPNVFATGYLVGLIEWACIKSLIPHLDWPSEQTVGIAIDVDHTAATPPGFQVTVTTQLIDIDGKRLTFEVSAHDDIDLISRGRHERFIIDKEKFDHKLKNKKSSTI